MRPGLRPSRVNKRKPTRAVLHYEAALRCHPLPTSAFINSHISKQHQAMAAAERQRRRGAKKRRRGASSNRERWRNVGQGAGKMAPKQREADLKVAAALTLAAVAMAAQVGALP